MPRRALLLGLAFVAVWSFNQSEAQEPCPSPVQVSNRQATPSPEVSFVHVRSVSLLPGTKGDVLTDVAKEQIRTAIKGAATDQIEYKKEDLQEIQERAR